MRQLITHEELLKYCAYNAKTGIFTLKRNGARIGHYDKNNGKRTMHINGKKYQESRLAIFYVTGKWPGSYVKNTSKTAQYNTKLRYLVYSDGNEFISGTQLKPDPHAQGTLMGKVKDFLMFVFLEKMKWLK